MSPTTPLNIIKGAIQMTSSLDQAADILSNPTEIELIRKKIQKKEAGQAFSGLKSEADQLYKHILSPTSTHYQFLYKLFDLEVKAISCLALKILSGIKFDDKALLLLDPYPGIDKCLGSDVSQLFIGGNAYRLGYAMHIIKTHIKLESQEKRIAWMQQFITHQLTPLCNLLQSIQRLYVKAGEINEWGCLQ